MHLSNLASVGLLAAFIALLSPASVQASQSSATETWVSNHGDDMNTGSDCQIATPCQTLTAALTVTKPGGTIFCLDPGAMAELTISQDVTIDCPAGFYAVLASFIGGVGINIDGAGINVTLRNLAIYGVDTPSNPQTFGIQVNAAALVRLENCKIYGFSTAGVDVVPRSGAVTVKIQDSTITKNNAGILVAPISSASVSLSIERSRIENNAGGGVKTVTSSGAINASISESSVSYNSGNGLNAVSSAGAQNMIVLTRDIIASNGNAGIQANGTNAAALIDTTLLDSNATGATAALNGGRVLTYGNNRIVGTDGSGFTGSATLR
jgi:hypothetical protein